MQINNYKSIELQTNPYETMLNSPVNKINISNISNKSDMIKQ